LTRSELIDSLAAQFPALLAKDISISVALILDAIKDTLAVGNRVEVRDFGSFSVGRRPARVGRNPKTGVEVRVPAKFTPHFKAGKELAERVKARH
jgi:integration host factor subunit beta